MAIDTRPERLNVAEPSTFKAVPTTDRAKTPTPLRLLLDAELGTPVRLVRVGDVCVAQFSAGLAIALPGPEPGKAMQLDVSPFLPRTPKGRIPGLFVEIDFHAVDSYLTSGLNAQSGLPEWVLETDPVENSGTPLLANLRQFALESGFCAPRGVPGRPVWGEFGPSVRLRRVVTTITLVPGSGRIILFDSSPLATRWRRYFGDTVSS